MDGDTRFADIFLQLRKLTARVNHLEHKNIRLSRKLHARTAALVSVLQQSASALHADESLTDSDSDNALITHPHPTTPSVGHVMQQQQTSSPTSMPPSTLVDEYSLSPELGPTTTFKLQTTDQLQTSPELSATESRALNQSMPKLVPSQHHQEQQAPSKPLPAEASKLILLDPAALPVSEDEDEGSELGTKHMHCRNVAPHNASNPSRSATKDSGTTNGSTYAKDGRQRQEEPRHHTIHKAAHPDPHPATNRRSSRSRSRPKSQDTSRSYRSLRSRSPSIGRRRSGSSQDRGYPPRYGCRSRSPVQKERRVGRPRRFSQSREGESWRPRSPTRTRHSSSRSRSKSGGPSRHESTDRNGHKSRARSPAKSRTPRQEEVANDRGWRVSMYSPKYDPNPATSTVGWAVNDSKSPTSNSKVVAWKLSTDMSPISPSPDQNGAIAQNSELGLVRRPSSQLQTSHGFEVRVDTGFKIDTAMATGHSNGEEEDDNDDNIMMALMSPEKRQIQAMANIQDGAGIPLTYSRLVPVWSVCAWVPLNNLSSLFQRVYKAPLWSDSNQRHIKSAVQEFGELTATQVEIGNHPTTLLLHKKCPLMSNKAYNRIVASQGTEKQLYFYLATTVLWPVEYNSSTTIFHLWTSILKDFPQRIRPNGGSGGMDAQISVFQNMWTSTIDWLVLLADKVIMHGPQWLVGKVQAWDVGSTSAEATLGLIEGLDVADIRGLLEILPILLSRQLGRAKKLDLDDALNAFFNR